MKKISAMLLHIIVINLLFTTTTFNAEEIFSRTDQAITIPSSLDHLSKEKNMTSILTFTDNPITLYGLHDSTQFFYKVPKATIGENNYLDIYYTHSSLLKEPSSMTVYIDNRPIESVLLKQQNQRKKTIRISLPDEALKEGFHSISIAFYGYVMDDICVNENHSANWMTIEPESYLLLDTSTNTLGEPLLQDFPYPFIQSGLEEEVHTSIVIPDQPSEQEVTAALILSNYLQTTITVNETIDILTESSLHSFHSHYIIIGKKTSFQGIVKNLYDATNIRLKDDHITFANYFLQGKEARKQVLFITALSDDVIEKKIHLLTEEKYVDQLVGHTVSIQNMPNNEKKSFSANISFEDLQIGNLTLSNVFSLTQDYFYKLPTMIDPNQQAYLHMKLKKSDVLMQTEPSLDQETELIIWINNVPHSVAIERLTTVDENGYYKVDVPVDSTLLNQSSYLNIRLEAVGLTDDEGCVPTDNGRWIYFDSSSYLFIPLLEAPMSFDFSNWPAPYASQNSDETMIIIPDTITESVIHQLQNLISTLASAETSLRHFHIAYSANISEDLLKKYHLIFIGGTDVHSVLNEKNAELVVHVPNEKEDLTPYQLLNETTERIAYIQPSPWNNAKSLTVFATTSLEQSDVYITDGIVTYLQENNAPTYLIGQSKNNGIFAYQKEKETEAVTQNNSTPSNNERHLFTWFGLSILFITSMMILVTLIRKK